MTIEQVKINFLWIKVFSGIISVAVTIIAFLVIEQRNASNERMMRHDRELQVIKKYILITTGFDVEVEINQADWRKLHDKYDGKERSIVLPKIKTNIVDN